MGKTDFMDVDVDGPLDFEFEDPLVAPDAKRRWASKKKKVIGLDDLLTDFYKEKRKVIERESKRAKTSKYYDSEDSDEEALLSKTIADCHFKIDEVGCGEENASWGMQVFGEKKSAPRRVSPVRGSNSMLMSFMRNKLNSVVKLTVDEGKGFFEGLLMNGWLSKLVSSCGRLDKAIAQWTFHLMLYSSKEELSTAACNFWCSVVQVDQKSSGIKWFPSYSDLKLALETYGFLNIPLEAGSSAISDNHSIAPPENIQKWIKFIAVCCQVSRSKRCIFSSSEAESLLEVVILLSLDRQLEGILVLLYETVQSVINYFTEVEWPESCRNVAKSLASRVPKDLNCLRTLECIPGITARASNLRAELSHQLLLTCFDKASNEQEILNSLIAINVREKQCDLLKMYIYIILAENWLHSSTVLGENPVLCEMWGVYLRNCSCHIGSSDLRPYAAKVRSRATYLIHNSTKKY
ncbi:hypothetical protein LINGRAHAP2_LOCUS29733 [Linum grandiflorum]